MLLFSQKQIIISKLNNKVIVDGLVSIPEWGTADSTTGFIQLEPNKGAKASETTVAYSFYNDTSLYVALKCSQDKDIIANIQTRDQVENGDDAILIVLDTYFDKRSGYGFVVNPLNTQTDFRINDDGRTINRDWDTQWQSAVKRYDRGWSAEVVIPFNSIKYNKTTRLWGINFGRIIRSKSETVWWSGALNSNFRISQNGILAGITPPNQAVKFTVTPYVSLRYENSDVTGNYEKIMPDGGIDFKFRPNPNMVLDATINPDFASVEGDKEQIDLSGWEENFPEKRLFFQEGNELFDMRYRLFYSRRIGDISYGAKFTGKSADYSMNILNTRSITSSELGIPAAFYTAVRVKKDVLKSSSIGATFVDKSSDTSFVRSYGLDWVLNPGINWKITGQLIGSSPGPFPETGAGFLRVAHESNKHHIHLRYSDLGKSFKQNVNETGFIQDDDRRELDGDITYTFWLQDNIFKYIALGVMNNFYWNHTGIFESAKFRDSARFYLQNRISLDFYYENENRLVDISKEDRKRYYNYYLRSALGYNTDESAFIEGRYTFGKNFGREMIMMEGGISINPLTRLTLKYTISKLDFNPDELDKFALRLEHSTVLNILSLNYYFTTDLWIRLFAQNDTYKKRNYLYAQFGWRFKPPFGAFYLIYAGDKYYDLEDTVAIKSKTIFIKMTYPLNW